MLDTWHAAGSPCRAKKMQTKNPPKRGEFGRALARALWLALGPISYAVSHDSFSGLHL